ncbi:hypothetical protein HYT55_05270 [Candidatus Woesearchaeota archaeon]|nr:hypothetical protein [Candidatus Woesearchaeota archaeon]
MHKIFSDLEWEVEEIRNPDQDPEVDTTAKDTEAGLVQKLAGCTYLKAIRRSARFAAQIRVEERYRQRLIYVSALVLRKDGRDSHHYTNDDIIFYQSDEFNFPGAEGEHPEFLGTVYEHAKTLREQIDKEYFPKDTHK